MVLDRVCLAAFGVIFAWSGPSTAQQYRPGEYLNLDLSRAVLSPKPLGPAAGFAPGPLDVTIDRGKDAAQAGAELLVDPKPVAAARVHVENDSTPNNSAPKAKLKTAAAGLRAAHASAERSASHKPHTLVALHGRNPMEAQARETKVQTWPCKSGGICNWKR